MTLQKKFFFNVFLFLSLFFANSAKAVCPVCVVAVGAGLGLSRWLGVDDLISSTWIGALLLALAMWTIYEFKKRNWKFPFYKIFIFFVYYGLTIIPLWRAEILGHPLNTIFGIDRIIFGVATGTLILFFSDMIYNKIKEKNGGKPHFHYEKVVIPFALLLIMSLIFYILINNKII